MPIDGGGPARVAGGQSQQGAPGQPQQGAAGARGASQPRTWMDERAAKGALIYAGGDASSYVLAYPSGRLVGTIAMTSFGTCSDLQGNVYFTKVGSVVEFAHGGTTPIATYSLADNAYACSVDPISGNIAVVALCASGCGGELIIIRPGSGLSPTIYRDPALPSMLYCTYDDQGNVFVDGYNGAQFGIAELPNNGAAFVNYTVSGNIPFANQIQWDGQYLAVETRIHTAVYQVAVSGSTATVVNTVNLMGVGKRSTQSWIQKGKIAVPTAPSTGNRRAISIIFWAYPAGGQPVNAFNGFIGGGHQMIDGVTFSVAPH